jgi:hypothetical protein
MVVVPPSPSHPLPLLQDITNGKEKEFIVGPHCKSVLAALAKFCPPDETTEDKDFGPALPGTEIHSFISSFRQLTDGDSIGIG